MYLDELDSMGLKANPIYEPQETRFIQSFLKPDMICVDVGAFIGYFTIMMAKIAKRVYAFEPEQLNCGTLLRNVSLNGRQDNVLVYPYAVGSRDGQSITLYKCATNHGMHRVYLSKWCHDAGVDLVNSVTLDWIVEHADFIKMDIEGSEYGALLGMQRILKESRPTILMEFHVPSIIEYGVKPIEIINYLNNLDYKIWLLNGRPIINVDELFRLGQAPAFNIICKPNP